MHLIEKKLTGSIEHQAQVWLVYLYSNSADNEGRELFLQWLKRSSSHVKAYKKIESIWRDVPLTRDLSLRTTEKNKAQRKKNQTIWYGLSLAASFLLCVLGYNLLGESTSQTLYFSSQIGEVRTIILPDKSRVTLGASSSLEVEFNNKKRNVELQSGTAYFDIKHINNRPFNVLIAKNKITVVGTEFEVRRLRNNVRISVTQGTVKVSSVKHTSTLNEVLSLGERIELSDNALLLSKGEFDYKNASAWKNGRLVYVDEPLSAIVEDVNRYRNIPIIIKSSELSKMSFTVSFAITETDKLLNALKTLEGISLGYKAGVVEVSKE
ncbi:FecR family protein [Pseudoalteromonas agarivorans]|uniref:Transmembrane sensor n=1 Tax=Pseudoalteromonas agarivorans DSM 14585 TaxID=1312369 RepID=A0ACA8DRU0_9GAMM|nr:FecR domain-containing protein [Pseudoalteromonas agarivorans]ATC80831.1 transmembrane sensor [Pseudoalteromonas agarivorans DSM 14585]